MITAGVDVGIEKVKVVVLKDQQVLARSIGLSGGAKRAGAVEQVWNEALQSAGISPSDVNKVTATGQGKHDVKFANDRVVEPVADVRAALFLYPSARSVVDIGADQVRVMALDSESKILEVVMNQKCAAGLGIFLRSMARMLGMSIEEMSQISGNLRNDVMASDQCGVFAELDVVTMLHNNTPKPDIIQAINEAVATRINSVMNDKIPPGKDSTVLIGGVTKNTGAINALRKRSGINFLIPEQAEFAGALGAAVIAAG